MLLSKNNAKTLLFRNAQNAATLKKEERMLQKERNSEEKFFLKQREHMLLRQSNLAEELSPRARRKEMDTNNKQKKLSASSSSLPEMPSPPRTRVATVSRSKTFSTSDRQPDSNNFMKAARCPKAYSSSLSDQSSPPRSRAVTVSRSKTFSGADRRPVRDNSTTVSLSPSSSTTLSMSDQLPSSPRPSSKMLPDSVSRLSDNSMTVSLPDINTFMVTKVGNKLNGETCTKLLWKGYKTGVDANEEICAIDDWQDLRKCRYLRTYSTEK